MSLTLGTVITAARDKSPAFHKTRVPDAVLARELTGYQRRVISKGADLDSNFVAQQCSIIFATSQANTPGAIGAGSQGGLPADASNPNAIALSYKDTGPAVRVDPDTSPVLVPDTVVSAATALTLTKAAAGWVVNQYANKFVWIPAGTGRGQLRQILSNTATVLTISSGADGQQWTTVPDATSMFRVIDSVIAVDGAIELVTEITPTDSRSGFLVRLNAAGVPFIDVTAPIVATFDRGIPLPPHERLIGGTVRHMADTLISDLTIRPFRMRFQYGPNYTVWIENDQMFLCGAMQNWVNAAQIDLRYVPIPPDFTRLTDYFLLSDDCYEVMAWRAAYIAGCRVNAMPDAPKVDCRMLKEEWQGAEENFLSSVGAHNRAYPVYVKDTW